MKNYIKCGISNCKNTGLNSKDARCQAFPQNEDMREEQVLVCKTKDKFEANISKIYYAHFIPENYASKRNGLSLNWPIRKELQADGIYVYIELACISSNC